MKAPPLKTTVAESYHRVYYFLVISEASGIMVEAKSP
jgi:hypothetical protein